MSQMTVSARLGAAVLRPPARAVDGLRTDRRTRVLDAAPAAVVAAALCFVVRMLGVHYDLNAPYPPEID